MEMSNFNRIKNLYDKGFRCIKYEDGEQGEFMVYLKNFDEEKIDSVKSTNQKEIQEIKNFIDTY